MDKTCPPSVNLPRVLTIGSAWVLPRREGTLMSTQSPAMTAYEDQQRRLMTEGIRRHGVWNTYVSDAEDAACSCCEAIPALRETFDAEAKQRGPRQEPPVMFCYTTGLFGVGHPELVVFGLSAPASARLLNQLARGVWHGRDLLSGELIETADPALRLLVEELHNPGEILFEANGYYQRPPEFSVAALQLTWADQAGRFPWEEGYAGTAYQPRPGTFDAR